jgi:hypothetical protein
VILEHPTNVEIFNINRIETTNERISRLVVEIQPCSLDPQMGFCQQDFRLLTAFALLVSQFTVLVPTSTAFQSFLRFANTGLCFFQVARIGKRSVVVGERGKLFNADIYSNVHACFW